MFHVGKPWKGNFEGTCLENQVKIVPMFTKGIYNWIYGKFLEPVALVTFFEWRNETLRRRICSLYWGFFRISLKILHKPDRTVKLLLNEMQMTTVFQTYFASTKNNGICFFAELVICTFICINSSIFSQKQCASCAICGSRNVGKGTALFQTPIKNFSLSKVLDNN